MAKKLLQVSDFASGFNSDLIPWDLPPGTFTDFENMRILNGSIGPFGGDNRLVQLPEGFIPGYLMFLDLPENNYWIIPGYQGTMVYDGNNFFDITPTGAENLSDEDLWHGCHLSRIPVLNHPGFFPVFWNPQEASQPLEQLAFRSIPDPEEEDPENPVLPWVDQTWQEAGERCRIMRSHKQFLIAMDLQTLNYGDVPDGVRWSSPADIGGLPETWDELNQQNVAGLTQLGGDGGSIIDGLTLRDSFVIYRERGISVMDYIPNSPYVFRIRHLETTYGLSSPDSIIEVKGAHFFLADGDILVNDGTNVKSLIHNRIRKKLIGNFNADTFENSFVVKNSVANEAWFCIPTEGATHPDKAFVFNWRDNSWSVRDIPTTPFGDYGARSTPELTWQSVLGEWDISPLIWNRREISPSDDTVVIITKPQSADNTSSSGELRIVDASIVSGKNYVAIAERLGFPLESVSRVTTITSLYPHATGGPFWIKLGSMDWPGSPVRWKPRVRFDPATMRKVDIRSTGELHCYQLYDDQPDTDWAISGMEIEYTEAGLR